MPTDKPIPRIDRLLRDILRSKSTLGRNRALMALVVVRDRHLGDVSAELEAEIRRKEGL
jgi:hypothetical protein